MKKKNILMILFAILIVVIMILALANVIDEKIGMCISIGLVTLFNLSVSIFAFKKDIKIIGVLMILFMLIGLTLLGINIYTIINPEKEPEEAKFRILIKEDRSDRKILIDANNRKYYTFNLETVDVEFKDKTYSLKEAFEVERVSLEDILDQAIPNNNTDGYKIYYDGGQGYQNDKYSIVVCENSKNVVFAPYSYKYDPKICEFSDED